MQNFDPDVGPLIIPFNNQFNILISKIYTRDYANGSCNGSDDLK